MSRMSSPPGKVHMPITKLVLIFSVLFIIQDVTSNPIDQGKWADTKKSADEEYNFQLIGARTTRALTGHVDSQVSNDSHSALNSTTTPDHNQNMYSVHKNDSEVPKVIGLGFPSDAEFPPESYRSGYEGDDVEPVRNSSTSSLERIEEEELLYRDIMMRQILLAVTCFFGGMLITSLTGLLVYFQKRRKWKQRLASIEASLSICPKSGICGLAHHQNKCSVRYVQLDPAEVPRTSKDGSASRINILQNDDISHHRFYTCDNLQGSTAEAGSSLPKTLTRYSGPTNIFVNQFSGVVGSEGGEVSCPESDVMVVVPPGAIPPGLSQPIYVNVSLHTGHPQSRETPLSPVVEFLSPGLVRFLAPVTIRIPHRASIQDSDWHISVHQTFSALTANTPHWNKLPKKKNKPHVVQPICYTLEPDFIYVHTYHSSTFSSTGTGRPLCVPGRPRLPLKQCVLVYGHLHTQAQVHTPAQVHLHLYICDHYADTHKHVQELESRHNGSQLSEAVAVTASPGGQWQVSLTSTEDPLWPWTLLPSPHSSGPNSNSSTQMIPVKECYKRPIKPACVTFICVPTVSNGNIYHGNNKHSNMEASIKVGLESENGSPKVYSYLQARGLNVCVSSSESSSSIPTAPTFGASLVCASDV